MDWQLVTEVAKALWTYGTPMVITAVVIVGVIYFVIWLKGHVDRKIAKDEERREKDEARKDVLTDAVARNSVSNETLSEGIGIIAKQAEKQTDLIERMDRRLDEHGVKIDRMHSHLFGEKR